MSCLLAAGELWEEEPKHATGEDARSDQRVPHELRAGDGEQDAERADEDGAGEGAEEGS